MGERAEPVQQVATAHGRRIAPETREFMESRFQHDFRDVRVFDDERAGRAVDSLGARAVTLGSAILFGRGEYSAGLLAHELAHVVQSRGAGNATRAEAEADADRAAGDVLSGRLARPSLLTGVTPHFKLRQTGRVAHGEYTIDIEPEPKVGLTEQVRIEFMPDSAGPVTDQITFLQIAQVRSFGKALPWGPSHPGEEIVDRIRTAERTRAHETRKGETLASVAIQHYGVPEGASRLHEANQGLRLDPDPQAPLPAGIVLTVPGAVQADYSLDIDAKNAKPRKPGDPNVSGNYPHLEFRSKPVASKVGELNLGGSSHGRAIGRNPVGGKPESAVMTDLPGGGPNISTFRFETTAHAEDIGVSYGAIQWGFDYDPTNTGSSTPRPHLTKEFARITQHTSDTVGAAIVAFNKDVGNRHAVQQGETLRDISLMYFNTSAKAHDLFLANPGILPEFDPDKPLPAGRELELNVPTRWAKAKAGTKPIPVKPSLAEEDNYWRRLRRSTPP